MASRRPHHGIQCSYRRQTKRLTLEPAWTSVNLNVPEPVVIANGVVLVLSTGENSQQTVGANVVYSGRKTLTDVERSQHKGSAVLYALDAETGKVLTRPATPSRAGRTSTASLWPTDAFIRSTTTHASTALTSRRNNR
jgi:hypothetical protein